MNRSFRMMALASACALLASCSAHSPFILKSTTDSAPVSHLKHPAHQEKVFVMRKALPAGVAYDPVSPIDVGKVWYGGSDSVLASMADRARELGANAVVEVKTWRQPAGWSWAAPHGSGQAVYVEPAVLATLGAMGGWY
ncbi:MAG TPA: hypothetical protein VJM11_09935 [Nevskiaceae bacterium]|nr:hypothetical protein [Nevskiaceae bacterium]